MINDVLPFVLQGLGGAVLGPILSALTGGKGFGFIGNAILGVLGGIGAGQGLNAIGMADTFASLMGGGPMRLAAEFLKGGIGGGVLGIVAGLLIRRR